VPQFDIAGLVKEKKIDFSPTLAILILVHMAKIYRDLSDIKEETHHAMARNSSALPATMALA
jgi:hypothetical protein